MQWSANTESMTVSAMTGEKRNIQEMEKRSKWFLKEKREREKECKNNKLIILAKNAFLHKIEP